MAYAALVSTMQLLEQTKTQDPFDNLFSIKQQINTLNDSLCFLQSFLEHDSSKSEQALDHLETRIQDVAYRAQDIIDFHVLTDHERLSSRQINKARHWRIIYIVQKVVSLLKKRDEEKIDLSFNITEKLYQDLEKVVDEVDSIVEEVMKIKTCKKFENSKYISNYNADFGLSRIVAPTMVGFDEEVMEIKVQLCSGLSKLQIIPIIGMGGIGKTTLSSNIFYDPLIVYHFHIRAWITITQRYNVRDVLLGLLSSMTTITKELSRETEEKLSECLYNCLKGRKYLIVLDDIWNTQVWDDLKILLPDDHNESRVILTTRLVDVAVYANCLGPFHCLPFLNEDQSWDLLREKVFADECCPHELEEIGKLIAKNCRGLPLSIAVVGRLLSKVDRIKCAWEDIAGDVSLAVIENFDHLTSKILSLSYNHLPRHLKACFLYLGCFPEDYEIPVYKLISLWVAEGFIKPMGCKSLEQVGEEYLEDLVRRCLVLVTKKRSDGRFKSCIIHDLLRDLCIRKAREDNLFHVMDGIQKNVESKCRRLCFPKYLEWYYFVDANAFNSPIRSLFCYYYNDQTLGFRLLRVLDVLGVLIFEYFPTEILQLFHLRYLAFTCRLVCSYSLHPSLAKLRNLETLIVYSSVTSTTSDVPKLIAAHLPIWEMPQLRHLIFPNITLLPFSFPRNVEFCVLKNLQTLSRVRNFRFTDKAVEMIPNLKKLKVIYSGGSEAQRSDFGLNNLVHLNQLETLNLKFHPSSDWWRNATPSSFRVPLKLKKLTLCGSRLSWKEMTVIGSLADLEVLKLLSLSVMGGEWEPIQGEFTRLKYLMMEWLDLKCWIAEDIHFPRLERLIIRHCSLLENIPSGIGEINSLQMIEVDDSKLAEDSARVILDEQRSMGNDVLHIHVGKTTIS